ncbi:MAG: phosphoglucosamine mutase [Elusimicrobia bacterium]|nr:phosphoglucosamine mutase [Elusimicrobiota bacterium]
MRLFGTDGIRGKAGKYPLDSKTVIKLGIFAAKVLKRDHLKAVVIIGRDTRISGKKISSDLKKGLISSGLDVWDVGVIPTPGISYLVSKFPVLAGAVISASHNPYQDNGIKFFSHKGTKLPDSIEKKIEDLLLNKTDKSANKPLRKGKIKESLHLVSDYENFLKKTLPKNLNLSGLKIVVDCANGATYKLAPKIFSSLGAELKIINSTPDGKNINKESGSLNPENLSLETLKQNADCGIAFDGDGDRVIFVDEKGIVRDGDFLLNIAAQYLKENGGLKNNTLVTTVMANLGLIKAMQKKDIKLEQTSVGDRYVYEEMDKSGANLGGEQSGHIIFKNFMQTGDGILSALQILSIMKIKSKPLSVLCNNLKKYPQVLLNSKVEKKIPIEKLTETKKTIRNVEDKLRSDGRVLVRYSGTENLLRVMIEGLDLNIITDMAKMILDTAKKEISKAVGPAKARGLHLSKLTKS